MSESREGERAGREREQGGRESSREVHIDREIGRESATYQFL